MQKVTTTSENVTVRRQQNASKREYTYLAIPTSLMSQVDQLVESATDELGMPKYSSRNNFGVSAIRALAFAEKRRSSA